MERTENVIAELVRIYETAVSTLRSDIAAFAADGTPPPADRRPNRAWCYPEVRIRYGGVETRPDLARAFGRLGQAGEDNGILLLVVKLDRKMRIEVGYGLEGTLTDLLSSLIINDTMVPFFRAGDFNGGVSAAVNDNDSKFPPDFRLSKKNRAKSD